jgi:predicted acetyltransferase
MWWIMEGDAVQGGIALRTATNAKALRLGHLGYGIRPSARRRGIATWAVGELLPHARAAGLSRLLLVCLDDNVGSIKTIERHGGVLEQVVDDDHRLVRRYWIDL